MFGKLLIILSAGVAFILSSCAPEQSQIILAKYDDSQINVQEYKNALNKNFGAFKSDNDSIAKYKNFLNLYVDYKLKLKDAIDRGLNNDKQLLDELNSYKKDVGISYFLEKNLVDPAVEQLYERRKWEYRVSHIMIKHDAGGGIAKAKADSLLKVIQNGASFEEIAKANSQDGFTRADGGDIYYITAGILPTEFEDAVYSTNVGQVYPKVVETKYGFHIIKVTDKKPRIPEIRASHILFSKFDEHKQIDTVSARQKADSVYNLLKNGANFEQLAKEFSDDTGTKLKGGDLGFFPRRSMVKSFDEAAFNLNVGQYSGIVKSNFGYHIIKVTDKKSPKSFNEEKDELKLMYKRRRFEEDYSKLIDSLKSAYSFKLNEKTYTDLSKKIMGAKVGDEYKGIDSLKNLPLFNYNKKSLLVDDFLNRMNNLSEYKNKLINSQNLKTITDKISGDVLMEDLALNLDKTDSVFASLMNDYKDGLMIFKLQELEVWNKIKIDTTKLHEFYLQTKNNYIWPNRVEFTEIFTKSDSAINGIYQQLKAGADFDSLAAEKTQRFGYKEKKGRHELQDAEKSNLAKVAYALNSPGDYSEPFKDSGGYSIVKLVKKIPSTLKTFEEAKAEVQSAYQEQESKRLENEYLEKLRAKYQSEIYYDELQEALFSK